MTPASRSKLTLGKPPPPTVAAAIARVSGADLAAAAKARLAAPGRTKPASPAVLRLLKDPPPTPQSAHKQRVAWREEDLATCRERYPSLFDPERPVPLALAMRRELGCVLGIKRADRLLSVWTRRPAYLAAIAAGGMRYHLDGTEAGMIDPKHQRVAQEILATKCQSQQDAA